MHDHHPTHYDEQASCHYNCPGKSVVPCFIVIQDLSGSLFSLTSRKRLSYIQRGFMSTHGRAVK